MTFDDFVVNAVGKGLKVLDKTSRMILVYDLHTFEFLWSFPIPVSIAFKFMEKGDYYYLQTNGTRNTIKGETTNADVIAFNYKTGETIPLFDRVVPDNQNQFLEFPNIFYKNNCDEIFFILNKNPLMKNNLTLQLLTFFVLISFGISLKIKSNNLTGILTKWH